ncbi:MAG: hypothetical protein J6V73_03775, partial [Spirochaetaceae bacterium]|nr:hypothetical protein [Spirochaetaceae bacterium]
MAVTLFSCGGGGGGGGGIAKADHNQLHNDSGNSGWGKGIETTTTSPAALGMLPQQEYDEELLFSTFPPFFSPIDHIDMTMYINDTLVEGLTGLNATTKKDVIPEVQISDKVTGTAQVTLQDGTVRNARIGTTTIDIGTTKIALYTEYKYKIMTSSTTVGGEGTFYTTDPVDVSAFVPGSVYGYSPDLNVSYFSDGTDTFAVSGGKVSLTKGDKILTPQFYSELSVVCDGTGVTPYNGADSYVYDYAQNTDGVTLTIPVPALPGVTITGTVDGNAVTLNGGSTNYTTTLLPGQHTVSLSMNGGSNFSGSGQTLSKTISVYVKPDIKIKEIATGNKIVYDTANDVYNFRATEYGFNMPVEVVSDAATALSSYITMTNTYLDGSVITTSSTASIDTTHTIKATFSGYSVSSVQKTVSVKIRPVKITIPSINCEYDKSVHNPNNDVWLQQDFYVEAFNADGTDSGRKTYCSKNGNVNILGGETRTFSGGDFNSSK